MKLYVIRHGETDFNKHGKLTGWRDEPLNDEGRAQAKAAIQEIPKGINEIWSSDFLRTRQTADIINNVLQVPVIYCTELRERNFGSLQGKTWEQIEATYPGQNLQQKDITQEYDYRPFGGESAGEVTTRLQSVLNEIQRQSKGKTILIITSGGIIRLLHSLINKQIHEKVHNASIHEFELLESDLS